MQRVKWWDLPSTDDNDEYLKTTFGNNWNKNFNRTPRKRRRLQPNDKDFNVTKQINKRIYKLLWVSSSMIVSKVLLVAGESPQDGIDDQFQKTFLKYGVRTGSWMLHNAQSLRHLPIGANMDGTRALYLGPTLECRFLRAKLMTVKWSVSRACNKVKIFLMAWHFWYSVSNISSIRVRS